MLITLLSQKGMGIYSAIFIAKTVKNLKRDGVATTPPKLITPKCLQVHCNSLNPNWKILSSRPWAKWTFDDIIFIRRRHGRTPNHVTQHFCSLLSSLFSRMIISKIGKRLARHFPILLIIIRGASPSAQWEPVRALCPSLYMCQTHVWMPGDVTTELH